MAGNFFALPASSAALLLALVLGLADATPWAEPAETLVYRADEWSPRPTEIPSDSSKLFKRSSVDVAVCGWLGGNEALPAKCASGSSCVHDTIHGVVGCCTMAGACLQGVYTSCVDSKSAGWVSAPVVKNDGVTMWYVITGSREEYQTKDSTARGQRNVTKTLILETTFNIHAAIQRRRLRSLLRMPGSQMM